MMKLDPFCRDEGGRFVPKPEKVLAPLLILTMATGELRPETPSQWVARRVITHDGSWRVVFCEIR